jgi:two-component system, LytTR family, response regulator AlgR
MRILVADDESLARRRLVALLADCGGDASVVAEAANGAEVLAACASLPVDLVLLDIRMPGMDGIEAALKLAVRPDPPAVVFVTAYGEHALAAFDANAIDYLLKPVRLERLQRALSRARALTLRQAGALRGEADFVNVSYRGGVRRIPCADIVLLRADSKYVEVWHTAGMALTEESLRAIEERLPGRFRRVHRGALVAEDRIRGLAPAGDGRYLLELGGIDVEVEVSRRHLPEVRRLLRGGC